jgi:uncharacterized linocin/CFP29 family protein
MESKVELENEVAKEVFEALNVDIENNESLKIAVDKLVKALSKLPKEPIENEYLLARLESAKKFYKDPKFTENFREI